MDAVKTALTRLLPGCAPKSEADALALAVHGSLESDGLRCVATDETQATAAAAASVPANTRPLPEGWNASNDVYAFFYKYQGSSAMFVVKALVMEDSLIVHAASDQAEDVHCLELRMSDFVQFVPREGNERPDVDKMYSDLEALFRAVRVNITFKLLPELSKKLLASGQPASCATQADEPRPGAAAGTWRGAEQGGPEMIPPIVPDIGRSDLVPGGVLPGGPFHPGGFGEGSGSMFGPRHPAFGGIGGMGGVGGGIGGGFGGGMGGIAAPPGARIDPMGPPGVFPPGGVPGGFPRPGGRPREFPDNDLFRPPTGDDMFM